MSDAILDKGAAPGLARATALSAAGTVSSAAFGGVADAFGPGAGATTCDVADSADVVALS